MISFPRCLPNVPLTGIFFSGTQISFCCLLCVQSHFGAPCGGHVVLFWGDCSGDPFSGILFTQPSRHPSFISFSLLLEIGHEPDASHCRCRQRNCAKVESQQLWAHVKRPIASVPWSFVFLDTLSFVSLAFFTSMAV